MKYRLNIMKSDEADFSILSRYISVDKPIYVTIEFDEKDKDDIIKLVNETGKPSREIFGCWGEDNSYYEISIEGITKIPCNYSFKKEIELLKKYYKSQCKYRKHLGILLDKTPKTSSVEKFSVSRFKAGVFISKEHNIAFNYRMKKAKSENQPIVIFMPGGGCIGCDNIKPVAEFYGNLIWKKLKKYDCNILIPQTPYAGDYDYIDAIKQLSERVTKEVKADKNRIYIFGTSAGGHQTWASAYKYSKYYACAMPVMGSLRGEKIDYNKLKNIPLLVAHSSDDNVVSVVSDDETVEILKGLSANVKYVRWNKYGHSMASRFYKKENWDEWMFNQSLTKR